MKLDDYSKILLATSQINMLANNLNQIKSGRWVFESLPFLNQAETEINAEIDKALRSTVEKLSNVFEELAVFLDGIDAVSPIDVRISKAASEILLFDKDETEEEYLEQIESKR